MKLFKTLLCLSIIFSCYTCDEADISDLPESIMPECINDFVENNASQWLKIKARIHNEEIHYWINTGFNSFDADEYILNNQCDTVCYYGGWVWPSCAFEYNPDNPFNQDGWAQIWP